MIISTVRGREGLENDDTYHNYLFRFREVFFVTIPDLPAEFGAHRSVNHGVDSTQTEPQTLLKL